MKNKKISVVINGIHKFKLSAFIKNLVLAFPKGAKVHCLISGRTAERY